MAETVPTKTVYAGRLMLQVPATAVVKTTAIYRGCDVDVQEWARGFDVVKADVETKVAALSAEPMKRDARSDASNRRAGVDPDAIYAKTRLVGHSIDPASLTAKLGYHPKNDASETRLELFRLIGNQRLHLSMKDYSADRYSAVMGDIADEASRFQLLADGTAPDRPGFAVPGGFFLDEAKPFVLEEFVLTLRFPEHPDARFFLSSNAIRQDDEELSLSTRAGLEIRMLRESAPGLKVLGKESRKAAGQKGYWVGISAPYDEVVPGARLRKFFWSAEGVPNEVTRPALEMELMIEPTRKTGSTFKDDEEARKLFDQILETLQIRPGAV